MTGLFIPHGMPRFGRSPQNGSARPTWAERLQALKYVPPLLRMVYQTHRGYTLGIAVLRIVRGVVPVGVLWIGKLIIDAVIADVQAAGQGQPVAWSHLAGLIALELGIAVV